jgi:hypothetical protein
MTRDFRDMAEKVSPPDAVKLIPKFLCPCGSMFAGRMLTEAKAEAGGSSVAMAAAETVLDGVGAVVLGDGVA